MYKLAQNYKKYRRLDAGGNFDSANNRTTTAMGIPMAAAGILDAAFQPNGWGARPVGAATASGLLRGAAAGSQFGPIGTAAGAVIGGVTSLLGARKNNNMAIEAEAEQRSAMDRNNRLRSEAAIAQDPSLIYGNRFASYYAMGGPMETAGGTVVRSQDRVKARPRPLAENFLSRFTKAEGGTMTPLSNDAVAFNGPSHEQGGIDLPEEGAEVEGGETMKNNFIFSDRLGFADEHKRLEKAIGKIQDKGVMTPDRVNAVRRMQDRVQTLALSQEYFKHMASGGVLPDPTQHPQIAQV